MPPLAKQCIYPPPLKKGGRGGFLFATGQIPLNPPFPKGDFKLRRAARGFTLIELMVVLFLIALFSSLVIPRLPEIDAGGPERGARRIAGTTKFLYNEAALSGKEHRLLFDLDNNALRPRTLNASREVVAVKGLAAESQLPSGVKLLDVAVAGQEKVSSGVTTMAISPTGWLPQTVIHLESADQKILTIRLLSYTGSAEVYEGYREF